MISFSDLYEAVVQQPTPPQYQQTPSQNMHSQYGNQPVQQNQNYQQPVQQKSTGIISKIKSGYDNINNKYETGKSIVKGVGSMMLPMAGTLAMVGAPMLSSDPNTQSTIRTAGMIGGMALPALMRFSR